MKISPSTADGGVDGGVGITCDVRRAVEAFCTKSEAVLRAYLDRQVETGRISAKERECVGK